jgi:urease accessory protein
VNALTDPARPAVSGGQATLEVEMVFGESTVTSAYSATPMKLLTPVSRGLSVWAYTSNFGGGLVAGDQTRVDLTIGPEARCFLGTQSSTKVYRNPRGQPCSHTTHAMLASGAALVFLPEPIQAFADSHYTQRQEFHLQSGASLVLLEFCASGKPQRRFRQRRTDSGRSPPAQLDGRPQTNGPVQLPGLPALVWLSIENDFGNPPASHRVPAG